MGLGALLAYLFDPERGEARRQRARSRVTRLVEQVKSAVEDLRPSEQPLAETPSRPSQADTLTPPVAAHG
jgi:hypothetical protein